MKWSADMLIEFTADNFKSLKGRQTLSMVAGSFPQHSESNSYDSGLPRFGRLLRSAVIYGPNAAGKTNVLRALQFVQNLVVGSASTIPGTSLPYSPFMLSKKTRTAPSKFEVAFVQDEIRYEYGFSLDAMRICDEWLTEYANPRGRSIFERSFQKSTGTYQWKFSSFLKGQRSVWAEATRPEVLFLSMAAQLNSKQLLRVFEWFQKRLVVVVNPTTMNTALTLQLLDNPEGKRRLLPFLREADLGISGVELSRQAIPPGTGYISGALMIEQPPGSAPNVVKVTFKHLDDRSQEVALEIQDESAGTLSLFRAAGAWLNVLKNGEVLLFDEIDSSLHPKLTRFLIEKFHSTSTNPNNAQLLFTTHNTSLLDRELFRRDQVWFVEKDARGASALFPLTDFKPRNDEALERGYMAGRYGALPLLQEARK
jgi:AAA15 family ATPase/GTPase